MVFFRHVISKTKGQDKMDWEDSKSLAHVVDQCYEEFFTHSSISSAKSSGNNTAYNFRLQLRDLASVIAANQAQRAGDIGRLLQVWKRWSVMAQGKAGLTHYSKHLPRLIVLLEDTLPEDLSHVIKHCMLLPTGEREGHFVPKDFYLEQMNYLLKYFYNNLVS